MSSSPSRRQRRSPNPENPSADASPRVRRPFACPVGPTPVPGTTPGSTHQVCAPAAAVPMLLKLARAAQRLRHRGSADPASSDAIYAAHDAIAGHLAQHGHLQLTRTDQGVLVDGQHLPLGPQSAEADLRMQSFFDHAGAQSIIIRRGSTAPQLALFLASMVQQFWNLRDYDSINCRLREMGVNAIAVDELVVLDDESVREITPPPTCLTPLPDEVAQELLQDIQGLWSLATPGEQEALQRLARTVLLCVGHGGRPHEWPVMRALEGDVLSRDDAALAGHETQPCDHAALTTVFRECGASILGILVRSPSAPRTRRLHEHVADGLLHTDATARTVVARALVALMPEAPPDALTALQASLTEALRAECDREALQAELVLTGEVVGALLECGRYAAVASLRELLLPLAAVDPRQGMPNDAAEVLRRIMQQPSLRAAVEQAAAGDQDAAECVLGFRNWLTPVLLKMLRQAVDNPVRQELAVLVRRLGLQAGEQLLREIALADRAEIACRLVEIIPHATSKRLTERALGELLMHPMAVVRRRAAALIGEGPLPRLGARLATALLTETDRPSRAAIIQALGLLRYRAATETLTRLIRSHAAPRRERATACLALGAIGDSRAVDTLVQVATERARAITQCFTRDGLYLRACATRALGAFVRVSAAREALEKLTEDSAAQVRTAADEALQARTRTTARLLLPSFAPEQQDLAEAPLYGSLRELPFAQVCQLLARSRITGLLRVSAPDAEGEVYFEEGLVVAASYGKALDQQAFAALCLGKDGSFVVIPEVHIAQPRLRAQVSSMLLSIGCAGDENTAA